MTQLQDELSNIEYFSDGHISAWSRGFGSDKLSYSENDTAPDSNAFSAREGGAKLSKIVHHFLAKHNSSISQM